MSHFTFNWLYHYKTIREHIAGKTQAVIKKNLYLLILFLFYDVRKKWKMNNVWLSGRDKDVYKGPQDI